MATTHIINTSNPGAHLSSAGSHSSSSSNIVGVHYKVGKKIGEGSFGVIFEGESGFGAAQCAEIDTERGRLVRRPRSSAWQRNGIADCLCGVVVPVRRRADR
jgi:hypothetical protein